MHPVGTVQQPLPSPAWPGDEDAVPVSPSPGVLRLGTRQGLSPCCPVGGPHLPHLSGWPESPRHEVVVGRDPRTYHVAFRAWLTVHSRHTLGGVETEKNQQSSTGKALSARLDPCPRGQRGACPSWEGKGLTPDKC